VWVRDFDDKTVWFEVEDSDGSGIYGQEYSQTDRRGRELTGEWTEVRVVTSYVAVDAAAIENVPVTRPDSTNPTTQETVEVSMGNIQIDEAEHRSLVEKAGRVDELQSENATLKESEAARLRTERATEIISARAKEAKVEFSPARSRASSRT
jgi:F0F1-type ATP synthase epsilon subunit